MDFAQAAETLLLGAEASRLKKLAATISLSCWLRWPHDDDKTQREREFAVKICCSRAATIMMGRSSGYSEREARELGFMFLQVGDFYNYLAKDWEVPIPDFRYAEQLKDAPVSADFEVCALRAKEVYTPVPYFGFAKRFTDPTLIADVVRLALENLKKPDFQHLTSEKIAEFISEKGFPSIGSKLIRRRRINVRNLDELLRSYMPALPYLFLNEYLFKGKWLLHPSSTSYLRTLEELALKTNFQAFFGQAKWVQKQLESAFPPQRSRHLEWQRLPKGIKKQPMKQADWPHTG